MKSELLNNEHFQHLMKKVSEFDFEYRMSDDDRWYRKGQRDEDEITDTIERLFDDGYDPKEMCSHLLLLFSELSNTSRTHMSVRDWFRPYIFLKP